MGRVTLTNITIYVHLHIVRPDRLVTGYSKLSERGDGTHEQVHMLQHEAHMLQHEVHMLQHEGRKANELE